MQESVLSDGTVPSGDLPPAPVEHNGRLIINRGAGWYRIADFRGRYVDVQGKDAADALRHFIDSKTCNYDTPYADSLAWRAAGCPSRAEWDAPDPSRNVCASPCMEGERTSAGVWTGPCSCYPTAAGAAA